MEKENPRVVWITGASSGIGRALAVKFAANGDIVTASARNQNRLNELHDQIKNSGGICTVIQSDVQNENSIKAAAGKILSSYDKIDMLINNAGITYFEKFIDTSIEQFDNTINTNLRGTFLATKAVLPSMIKNNNGLVLNIVSYIIKEIYTKSAVYSASKSGIESMMNVLRAELRRQDLNINIVNVYPGAVYTNIWREQQLEKYKNQMLTPEQVADILYEISVQPKSLMVEEIILRPQGGDLKTN